MESKKRKYRFTMATAVWSGIGCITIIVIILFINLIIWLWNIVQRQL